MADRDIEEVVDAYGTPMLFPGFPERPVPPPQLPEKEAKHLARRKTIENRRERQADAIEHGAHPLNGKPLLPGEHTCGDCGHRYLKRLGRAYPKCDLGPNTGGSATDVLARWPACISWEAKPEGKPY